MDDGRQTRANPIAAGQREHVEETGTYRFSRDRYTHGMNERRRTGIEQFVIEERPNNAGEITMRDRRTDVGAGDFGRCECVIRIGDDDLVGAGSLIEHPPGSDRWRNW